MEFLFGEGQLVEAVPICRRRRGPALHHHRKPNSNRNRKLMPNEGSRAGPRHIANGSWRRHFPGRAGPSRATSGDRRASKDDRAPNLLRTFFEATATAICRRSDARVSIQCSVCL
jgi:hypothetical protein